MCVNVPVLEQMPARICKVGRHVRRIHLINGQRKIREPDQLFQIARFIQITAGNHKAALGVFRPWSDHRAAHDEQRTLGQDQYPRNFSVRDCRLDERTIGREICHQRLWNCDYFLCDSVVPSGLNHPPEVVHEDHEIQTLCLKCAPLVFSHQPVQQFRRFVGHAVIRFLNRRAVGREPVDRTNVLFHDIHDAPNIFLRQRLLDFDKDAQHETARSRVQDCDHAQARNGNDKQCFTSDRHQDRSLQSQGYGANCTRLPMNGHCRFMPILRSGTFIENIEWKRFAADEAELYLGRCGEQVQKGRVVPEWNITPFSCANRLNIFVRFWFSPQKVNYWWPAYLESTGEYNVALGWRVFSNSEIFDSCFSVSPMSSSPSSSRCFRNSAISNG